MRVAIKVRSFVHEWAATPYLERNVDCPNLGGEGNTPLEECMECERFMGMGDNNKFRAFIWCNVSGEAKKLKKKYNTKLKEIKKDSEKIKSKRGRKCKNKLQ